MKKLLFILTIHFSFLTLAQKELNWSEADKSGGKVLTPPLAEGDGYYLIHGIDPNNFKGFYNSMVLSHYEDGKKTNSYDFAKKLDASSDKFKIKKFVLINKLPVLVYTLKENGVYSVFAQAFSADCKPEEEKVLLISGSYDQKKEDRYGNYYYLPYEITTSQNGLYLMAALPKIEEDSYKKNEMEFLIFDKELSLISTREQTAPAGSKLLSYEVSDKGEPIGFFSILEGFQFDGKKKKTGYACKQMLAGAMGANDNFASQSQFKEKTIYHNFDELWNVNRKQIMAYGVTYIDTKKHNEGISGIFLTAYSVAKNEFIISKHIEFNADFLKAVEGDKRLEEDGLSRSFQFRNLFFQDDNSSIIVFENYVSAPLNSTGTPSGKSRYGNVLILKVDPNGEIVWYKSIQKEQVASTSLNEEWMCSIDCYKSSDQLFIAFNDDKGNYDAQGKFLENNPDFSKCGFSKKSSAIALVSLELNSGNMQRINALAKSGLVDEFLVPLKSFKAERIDPGINNEGVFVIKSDEEEKHLIIAR